MITYKQAAAIPYRIQKNRLEILLITARNGKKWIIPKGVIDAGDTAPATAAKETHEEAGVSGQVAPTNVGEFTYEKWGGICQVVVYPLLVDTIGAHWLEMDIRKRKWVSLKEALKIVKPKKVRKIVLEWADANGFK